MLAMAFAAAQQRKPPAVWRPCRAKQSHVLALQPVTRTQARIPACTAARRPAPAPIACCSRPQEGNEASSSGDGGHGAHWPSSELQASALRVGGVAGALCLGWGLLPVTLPALALTGGGGGGPGGSGGGGDGGDGGGGGRGRNVVADLADTSEQKEGAEEEEDELGRCASPWSCNSMVWKGAPAVPTRDTLVGVPGALLL